MKLINWLSSCKQVRVGNQYQSLQRMDGQGGARASVPILCVCVCPSYVCVFVSVCVFVGGCTCHIHF